MYSHIKRLLDFVAALFMLLLVFPIFLVTTLLLFVSLKGNPFFFQKRPGFKGRPFTLIKFRTMTNARNGAGELLPDAERMTDVGRWVRSTSLDEIPQLFNVLKGDMSFIGPRPLLMEYLDIYTEEEQRRHLVKPGISGWAQVNGRNSISWKEKFKLDIEYVDNLSLMMDLKILFLTIKKVLAREGISSETSVTMEKYNGSN